MTRGTGAILGVLLLAAAAGTMLVVAGGSGDAPRGSLAPRAGAEPAGLPRFDGVPVPERPAGEILPVMPPASTDGDDGTAHAAPDTSAWRRISGRVVRASDGTPLAGCVVKGGGSKGLGSSASRGPDGAFEVRAPPEAGLLDVSLRQGVTERHQTFALPPGEVSGLLVVYDSGFTLRGRVVDETAAPLEGASVDVGELGAATTDATGRFEIRDIARDPGINAVTCSAQAPWHTRERIHVMAPPDVTVVPAVTLTLRGSGALAGSVTDADGQPLADQPVKVLVQQTPEHGSTVGGHLESRTATDGAYRIDNVPPGRYVVRAGEAADVVPVEVITEFRMMPVADDGAGGALDDLAPTMGISPSVAPDGPRFAARLASGVDVVAGQATRLDFVLSAGARISGRVTDGAGAPVPAAEVTLRTVLRWPAPEQHGTSITSDGEGLEIVSSGTGLDGTPGESVLTRPEARTDTRAAGLYAFEHVTEGEKSITAADPSGRLRPQTLTLQVRDGEDLPTVDFVLAAGLELRGVVTEPSGAPIAGASVHVQPLAMDTFRDTDAVRTDDAGRFAVTGLSAGRQRLSISKPRYVTVWEEVEPGGAERVWIMAHAPRVRGEVTDDHGGPLEMLDVTLETEHSVWSTSGQSYPGGRFDLDTDDDAPCTVTVSADGFAEEVLEGVIPSLTESAPLRFRLRPRP